MMKSLHDPRRRRVLQGMAVGSALMFASATAHARMDVEMPMAYGRVPENLYALRAPYIFTHNVGLLTLQITNVGIIGNPFIDDLSAGWRGAEYLYFSGLWIGAIGSDSENHVSTASPFELRPDLDPRWTVYESFEGIKNGQRLGTGGTDLADDDGDGTMDEDFQDGFDNDGDGRIDEDYEAIGQQMFSAVYRDDTPEAIAQVTDHVPLNIRIQQRSFQWSTRDINEFVGFDFEIINTGEQRLKEVYLGFFSDSDAGPKTVDRYWVDDLVGWESIDTTVVDETKSGACARIPLRIDTAFMWDAPDNGTSIVGGDVPGVFGSLFLGHTTDDTGIRAPKTVGLTTVKWFSATGAESDPQNDDERYALLSSQSKPARNANKPDDYRYVIAAGPFAQLNPNESLRFQTAYVIGNRQAGFRRNAVAAQRVFNGRFVDADQNTDTGINGLEKCLRRLTPTEPVFWDDPCDTLNTQVEIKSATCVWVDADCNPCTGINGEETGINWVGTTAPPPPNINTDPDLDPIVDPELFAFVPPEGDRRVVIQWDNASELRSDPITQQKLFEGYRVWRVDNWERPEGSIGPSPDEWMLIAEFRARPKDGLGLASPNHLRRVENRDIEAVEILDDGTPRYPIGRYAYTDTSGIINGKVIFYAVTAFGGIDSNRNNVIDTAEELSGQPAAVEAEVVVPRWEAQPAGRSINCDEVKVVPNPYRGGADWDLVPSETDPTGTKLAFRGLPRAVNTIRIYTLSGDLILTVDHDGTSGDGTYFWNLITRNGQNVTSGVYLFSVEHPEGVCRGRFVIIR